MLATIDFSAALGSRTADRTLSVADNTLLTPFSSFSKSFSATTPSLRSAVVVRYFETCGNLSFTSFTRPSYAELTSGEMTRSRKKSLTNGMTITT